MIIDPNNPSKVADLSEEINIIPNQWGVIQTLGLFEHELKSQKTVLVPRTQEEDSLITDRNWDERNNTIRSGKGEVLPLAVPHYPVDDAITPNDIDGEVDWGSVASSGGVVRTKTLDSVRAKKMER